MRTVSDIVSLIDSTAAAFKRDPADIADQMFADNLGDDELNARVRQACSYVILREMECPEFDQ